MIVQRFIINVSGKHLLAGINGEGVVVNLCTQKQIVTDQKSGDSYVYDVIEQIDQKFHNIRFFESNHQN